MVFLICSITLVILFINSYKQVNLNEIKKPSTALTDNSMTIQTYELVPEIENIEYVCGVIVAEAGYDYKNQCLVAQCILNAAVDNEKSLYETVLVGYTTPRYDWENGKQALTDVLQGYRVVDENIKYFYAPLLCSSEWHESQEFVIEYGGHRYFKEVG